jgi:F0F1-type ATP synthase assembly protein I
MLNVQFSMFNFYLRSEMQKPPSSNKQLLMQYAGLAAQLAAGLLLAVYLGMWMDKWIGFKIPIFIWLLPLLLLIGMIVKAIRDTSKK